MKITYKGKTKECKYYKGLIWNKPLTPEMEQFKKETGKNAIRGNKITGTFEYWMYWNPKNKQFKGKPTSNLKDQKINNISITNDIELRNIYKSYGQDKQCNIYKYNLFYKNKSYGQDVLVAKNKQDLIKQLYLTRSRKFPFLRGKKIQKPTDVDKIRLEMLEILYYNLFYDTKMFAKTLNITTQEAYKHAKWLEDKRLISGQASSGTGVSTKRGTYKTLSILWEANYSEERGDDWNKVKDKYYSKKLLTKPTKKSKPIKTVSKKYIPKDSNIEKSIPNIEKLIKNNKNKVKTYNETFDKIEKLKKDGYGKNYKDIRELRKQLDSISSQIVKNNEKIFKFAKEAKIQTKYKKEPKSKKMLYYIERIEPF